MTTNGESITGCFKPVYRAVLGFRRGWDIYNEHFDYVDPHYLYPPVATLALLMAPFGYLPFARRRYLFYLDQHRGILVAAYLPRGVQLHADLGGRTRPDSGHVCYRDRDQHAVFTNINGIQLLEVLL